MIIKRMKYTLLLIVAISYNSHAQSSKNDAYKVLGQLVGGVWLYEGKWPNGETFKQEKKFTWGLNQNIIKVATKGIINQETKTYGLRNEGIRVWDPTKDKVKFYEFDVYGGVTEGYCVFEKGRFHYEYHYEVNGKIELFRDTWTKIDPDTYEYSVNMKVADGWKTYTTNQYKRITD